LRRIAIHGTSGSGKSTLARALAKRMGIEHIELDSLWHEPNWKEAELEVFRERVRFAVEGDGWVSDGNYRKVRDLVYPRCDTILWLDYGLPLILWRLTRRILRRGLLREELWHGNRESIYRHLFTRESLYLWVLSSYKRRRLDCEETMSDPALAHIDRLRFRSPRELRRWVGSLDLPCSR
jgi:adenylate kinase family enzyme